jgi:hypothetical protein
MEEIRRMIEAFDKQAQQAARLRAALAGLVEWGARTGGWEAPVWAEARAALDATAESVVDVAGGPDVTLYVTIEGGVVQTVSATDADALKRLRVVVVDYDTDGDDSDDVGAVTIGGQDEAAYVFKWDVEPSLIDRVQFSQGH